MEEFSRSANLDKTGDRPRLALFSPEADPPASGETPALTPAATAMHRRTRKPGKAKRADGRPEKPRDDFPLFAHASGRWAKKIRGNLRYFGKWSDDPKGERALNKWLDEKDDLLAGREPRANGDDAGPTIKLLVDSFLTRKEQQRDNGEIQPRTFDELYASCVRMAAAFGKARLVSDLRPDDFAELRVELAKRRGPVALGIEIQHIRSVFHFAFKNGIVTSPVCFGTAFDKPSAKVLRVERAKRGARDLQADQIRAIVDKAGIPLKAMVLLAVNAGFGNNDVGTLPLAALDLKTGWVSYSRPKTGISRRAKLWPETIVAINAAIEKRPAPRDKANAVLVFLTKYGASWAKGEAGNDPVGLEFKKILKDLGFHRDGIGFYSLRRSFRTVADQLPDRHAIDLVMGHTAGANDMGALYTQSIGDDRLVAIAEHVRRWLFPAKRKPQ
jgi:hypothetical protein